MPFDLRDAAVNVAHVHYLRCDGQIYVQISDIYGLVGDEAGDIVSICCHYDDLISAVDLADFADRDGAERLSEHDLTAVSQIAAWGLEIQCELDMMS